MSDDGSPNPAVRGLREVARQLITSMQATPDSKEKHTLAAQAFELLRQAAVLTEQEQETKGSPP
jgi:hypothetical protein